MTESNPQTDKSSLTEEELLPNGWSRKLYTHHIASQDVEYCARNLHKAFEVLPRKIEQLEKAVVRAHNYGGLTIAEIVSLSQGQLGEDDVRKILQEEKTSTT